MCQTWTLLTFRCGRVAAVDAATICTSFQQTIRWKRKGITKRNTSRVGYPRTSASKGSLIPCTTSGLILWKAGQNIGLQILPVCISQSQSLLWTLSGANWMLPKVLPPLPKTSVWYWKAISQVKCIPYGNTLLPYPCWILPDMDISKNYWTRCK